MGLKLSEQAITRYRNAFGQLLYTLPIMPLKPIIGLSQYAALAEYILRIGAILSGETIIPDIDAQSVEPQMNSEQPFVYIYFNLVKAEYFHFRGITDQAKKCCEKTFMVINNSLEKSPFDPDLDMAIWSYWLVHRTLENPNPDYNFDITSRPVPKPPLIAPQTVEILEIERDIALKTYQFQTEFIYDYNKSRKEALIHRFRLLSFYIKEERINILSDAEIECAFQYVSAASHLSTSDRLQIFWKEVIYLSALTKSFLDPEVQQLVDGTTLFGLLSNASTFSLLYNKKYYTMLYGPLSKMKSMFKRLQLYNAFEMRQENTTEQHITKKQQKQCEWCSKDFVELNALNNHRRKHAQNKPKQKIAYIPSAVPVIEEERKQKPITTPKTHTCAWCSKRFTHRAHLKKHRRKHAQNKPKQKIAYIPAAATAIEEERKQKLITTSEKKYICEWCDKSFTLLQNLTKHRQKHAQNKPKQRIPYIPAAVFTIELERQQKLTSL